VNKRLRRSGEIAVLAVLLIGWGITLRPVALGGATTFLVVRGDSMLPTYETGDLLVLRAAGEYEPGAAVGYRVPAGELGAGRIVVHRIVSRDASGRFVMQGDNNPAPDPWTPTAADIAGTVWAAVPGAGRVLVWVRQPAFLGAVAAALVAAVIVFGGGRPSAPAPGAPAAERQPAARPAARRRRPPRPRPAV
jgi:signal peptidase I